jgi:hypothetical protein
VAKSEDNSAAIRASRSSAGDNALDRPAPLPRSDNPSPGPHRIAPAIPRRFPHELEILIEVWDVDRNQITWPAWLAPPSSDQWALGLPIVLTPEACEAWGTNWPAWWVVTREVA